MEGISPEILRQFTIHYHKKYKYIFFPLFLLMGLINNLGSVLIITCSKEFSVKLEMPELIALYPIALIICSSLSRYLNSKFCLKLRYRIRIIMISIYFFTGYISLFVILIIVDLHPDLKVIGFLLSLLPSFIMGTGAALGEANILGYLRTFPKEYVSGWSCGTGFAGVVGATITLIFKLVKIQTHNLYLYASPVTLLYFLAFYLSQYFQSIAEEQRVTLNVQKIISFEKDKEDLVETGKAEIIETDIMFAQVNEISENKDNKEMTWENFKEAIKVGKVYIFNLAIEYYFEYTILTGFSERVSRFKYIEIDHLYECFCLCYQLGVLCSRSSLSLLKCNPYVTIYTVCQGINYILWTLEIILQYTIKRWIFFIHLIIVGLFGGASYVTCLFFLLDNLEVDEKIKELCVNIATMFNDLGILSASLTVLLLDNTFLKTEQLN